MTCRICGSGTISGQFTVREMMLGLRDPFTYSQCGGCGCLQLEDQPADLSNYYRARYTGFRSYDRIPRWRAVLLRWRARMLYEDGRVLSRVCRVVAPDLRLQSVARLNPDREAAILDVGGGGGQLVTALRWLGFDHASGIDPYAAAASDDRRPVVARQTLQDVSGRWDVITFQHSFEHVVDPEGTLRAAAHRLAPGGVCLIRMPVVPCYAWERYREHWVQLDAPRHLHVHSRRSLEILARRAGLRVTTVEHDSTSFQFWGSELYARDVPLIEANGQRGWLRVLRSWRARWAWSAAAARLNAEGRGDQAVFHLRRDETPRPSAKGRA